MTQPALMGGLVLGVLSALPIVSAANLCCCLWVVCGGVVAAYLLQQNDPLPISASDGALVGLLAGLTGAGVQFVLSIPISLLIAPMERAMLARLVDLGATMPPEMREMIESYARESGGTGVALVIVRRIVAFIFMIVIGAIFSTLGGLLGAAIFRRPASGRVAEQGALPPPDPTPGG
jgi:hypothetical protein